MPKSKETPAQKIKRLEKELQEEKIKTMLLNEMIDISDRELGTSIRKKLTPELHEAEKRHEAREQQFQKVKELVLSLRARMPRLGTRKLYFLLRDKFVALGIKLGRDAFFALLRREHLLVRPKKNYTKTTNSKHWLKKYPNLLKEFKPKQPEEVFVSDITYVKTLNKTYYLSLITDSFSRKIVGHNLSYDLSAEGAVKALDMAIKS
ncbi:Integrase catalytic region ISDde2, partial [Aduncisulcus paluster]